MDKGGDIIGLNKRDVTDLSKVRREIARARETKRKEKEDTSKAQVGTATHSLILKFREIKVGEYFNSE